jgi:hypothetical protein
MAGVLAFMNRKYNQELTGNGEVIGLSLSFYSFLTRLPVWLFSDPSPSLDFNFITTIGSMALSYLYILMGGLALSIYTEKGYQKYMENMKRYLRKRKNRKGKQGNNSALNIFKVMKFYYLKDSTSIEETS